MADTILITGGCGGLGYIVAGHLAGKGPVNLILSGRSPLRDKQRTQFAALEQRNCNTFYIQADVSDAEAMRRGVTRAKARFGQIDGVIHAAGLAGRQKLFDQAPGDFQQVLAPKVRGAQVLDEVLAGEPLRFMCYFSSTSAVLGDFGSCDYAVGNRFLMAYARHRNALREQGKRKGRTIVINWPLWREGGIGFGDNNQGTALYLKTSGQRFLETREGLALLDRFLSAERGESTQCLVFAGQPGRIRRFLGVEAAAPKTAEPANVREGGEERGGGRAIPRQGLRVEECLAWDLREMITELINVPRERLDGTTLLADFGFDSISLAQYARALSQRYSLDITPDLFFAHSTLKQLVDYFLAEHGEAMGRYYLVKLDIGRWTSDDVHECTNVEEGSKPGATAKGNPVYRAIASDVRRPTSDAPPIAIVGMSGRFPKARTVDELWKIFAEGINAIEKIPADRLGGNAASPCQWCGMIPGVAEFDPLFFEISPREAESMDPRQRLLLQEAWNALENAAYGARQIKRQRIGMFVGVEEGDYHSLVKESLTGLSEESLTGLSKESLTSLSRESGITSNHTGVLAARLAYFLNFKGPVMALNTACSSGLVAVHQACQSLHNGECDTALAAGVNLVLTPAPLIAMAQAGMLSPAGECRAFDKRANGIVPGEAVAVVVLKRLSQAIADGDPIHATILGSGINHDGRTNGITAPNRVSQTELIRQVYDKAGIEAGDIGYIIAHGTGTPLGDPVEINALNDAFRLQGSGAPVERSTCALTSTKPNLGHTFAASGLVNLLCMVQALRHQMIPPSLHCEQENDFIQWRESPFFVNKASRPWLAKGDKRRCGAVSAFGMSGTNAHLVVEEYIFQSDAQTGGEAEPPYYLLVLSAKTEAALKENANSLRWALEEETLVREGLAAIGYTLLEGRSHFRYRCAMVVESIDDARQQLNLIGAGKKPTLFQGLVPREFVEQKVITHYIADLLKQSRSLRRDTLHYREILLGLAEFYCQGYSICGEMLSTGSRRRISLPTYAFSREHYWHVRHTAAESQVAAEGKRQAQATLDSIDTVLFEPLWKPSPLPSKTNEPDFAERIVWVCTANEFSADGNRILLSAGDQTLGARYEEVATQVFQLLQEILNRKPETEIVVQLVVYGENEEFLLTGLTGLLRTAQLENPALVCQLIYIESQPSKQQLANIIAENRCAASDRQVRYRQGRREVLCWEKVESPQRVFGIESPQRFFGIESPQRFFGIESPQRVFGMESEGAGGDETPWRNGGVYLITGGNGELGRLLAKEISASAPNTRLILCGRSALSAPEHLGLQQDYRQVDISRWREVETLIADIEAEYGMLNGVVHCAGVIEDGLILNKTNRQFRAVLAPKVAGTRWLDRATRHINLDFFLLFSSSAGALGNTGQADYAAANGFMDAFAEYRNRRVAAGEGHGHTLSINWPLWREGGMHLDARRLEIVRQNTGIAPLETAAGMRTIRRVFRAGLARILVLAGEGSRLPLLLQQPEPYVQIQTSGAGTGQRLTREQIGNLLLREIRELLLIRNEQPLDTEATFVELGLDSIHSLRFMRELSKSFDVPLRETLVFDYPTIDALAEYLANQEIKLNSAHTKLQTPADFKTHLASLCEHYDEIVPLQVEGEGPLLFCIHPMSGDVGIYTKLAELAGSRFRIIGIRSRGFLCEREPLTTLEEMGRYYAEILSAIEPQQPKHIIGSSMGGTIAYETARQLQSNRENVHSLWLVEAPLIDSTEDAALWESEEVENYLMNANFLLIGLLHLEPDFREKKARGEINWSDLVIQRDETQRATDEQLVDHLVTAIKSRGVTPTESYLKQRLQSMAAIHLANLRALQRYRALPLARPRDLNTFFLRSRTGEATADEVYNPDYLVRVQHARGGLLPFFDTWQTVLPGITTVEVEGNNHFDLLNSEGSAKQMVERIAATLSLSSGSAPQPKRKRSGRPAGQSMLCPSPLRPASERGEYSAQVGEGIAIIGMSGRFPGAETLDQFYDLLKSGRSALSPLPQTRGWDLSTVEVSRGGFLPDIDKFDPLFFNIPPQEAALMDPAERLFLQECWKAIEDAGVDPNSLAGKNWGVFCGGGGDYTLKIKEHSGVSPHVTSSGIPGRVSYTFDLAGPCLAVDVGCASSLLALAQACDHLLLGKCEVAVAGGVMIHSTPNLIRAAWRSEVLSRDGQCLALDRRARGMAVGEGVCAVVLKPLQKALTDGDRIHAVIEGWGNNHNGKTNGMAAPSVKAQTSLVSEVYRRFRIEPETIGLVEANATGTLLGDTVEIQALSDAFRQYTDRQYCALGTVENHIGHAYQCSGMAHLMKVVLALKQREIPGTLHVEQPSTALESNGSPFFINRHAVHWPARNGEPRRAAINSFGATGANVHIVVAEAVVAEARGAVANEPVLIVFSAKTQDALIQRCRDLLAFIEPREVSLRQLSANLLLRRSHFAEHRCAMVASNRADLLAQLEHIAGSTGVPPATSRQIGGAKDLYEFAAQYRQGAVIDMAEHFSEEEKFPLSLPGYPFEKRRCWLENANHRAIPSRQTSSSSLAIIQQQVQDITGYRAEEMDPALPLSRYGLDSLMSMRLLALINERFGLELQLADLAVNDSLNALARLADHASSTPDGSEPKRWSDTLELDADEFTGETRWFFERIESLPEALHTMSLARSEYHPETSSGEPDWLPHCRPGLAHLFQRGIAVFNTAGYCYFIAHRSIDLAAEVERLDVRARESLLRHCPTGLLVAPLSQEQERNLYHSEVLKQSAWNVHHIYQSTIEHLDESILKEVITSLNCYHDLLRTRYVQLHPCASVAPGVLPPATLAHPCASSWAQLIEPEAPPAFQIVEMPSLKAFQRFVLERKNCLLPLAELPLFNLWLTKLGGAWYFGFVAHHSLADAFTTTLLFTDMMRRYASLANGGDLPGELAGEQYWQYALGQFDRYRYANRETAQFWRERLAGTAPAMRLPYNRVPEDVDEQDLQFAENRVITVPDKLNEAIDHFHQAHGITFTHLFSAAIALALVRGMGNEKALLQYVNNQRDRASLLNTLGEFTNILFVPFDVGAFSNTGSSSDAAEGSLSKTAEGSLSKTAEGSLSKTAEGSLSKTAEGSTTILQFLLDIKRQSLECLRHAKTAFSDLLTITGLENYAGYYRQRGEVMIDSADIDTATLGQALAYGSSRYTEGFDGGGQTGEGQALATLFFQLLRVNRRIHFIASYRKALFDSSELQQLATLIVDIVDYMVQTPERPFDQLLSRMQTPLQKLREWSQRFTSTQPVRPGGEPRVVAECQRLNHIGQGRPVFWFHAGGLGGVEAYSGIAEAVQRPFYGIQARGWMTESEPLHGVEAMATYYVQIIKSVQPEGPYDLGGYSLGGVLAYEATRQLQALGDEVASIVMLDSYDVVDTEPCAQFNKKTMLCAMNLALQSLEVERKLPFENLIHSGELDCSASDDAFWSELMALARERGLTKPEGQLQELVRQMTKFGRSLEGDHYSIPPLCAPRSVRCYYFRNKSGTFYGNLKPYFTLPGTTSLYVDNMNYWGTWEERLPNIEIMDVDSSSHTSLLSEQRSAEVIVGFCRALYSQEQAQRPAGSNKLAHCTA